MRKNGWTLMHPAFIFIIYYNLPKNGQTLTHLVYGYYFL